MVVIWCHALRCIKKKDTSTYTIYYIRDVKICNLLHFTPMLQSCWFKVWVLLIQLRRHTDLLLVACLHVIWICRTKFTKFELWNTVELTLVLCFLSSEFKFTWVEVSITKSIETSPKWLTPGVTAPQTSVTSKANYTIIITDAVYTDKVHRCLISWWLMNLSPIILLPLVQNGFVRYISDSIFITFCILNCVFSEGWGWMG